MLSTRSLKWLHRVGYAATLIVLLEVAGFGWLAGTAWVRSSEIAATQREDTRTHAGPLTAEHDDIVREDALELLSNLPPLRSLGADAARFVAMPSFGRRWFAIAVWRDGSSVHGLLVTMEHSRTDDLGPPMTETFSMPVPAYNAMIARTDRIVRGWAGDAGFWTDGTAFAFESRHGPDVISGVGNSPPHYGQIASAVRNGLAPYAPMIGSLGGDWMERRPAYSR